MSTNVMLTNANEVESEVLWFKELMFLRLFDVCVIPFDLEWKGFTQCDQIRYSGKMFKKLANV